jgi:hypothetical protein
VITGAASKPASPASAASRGQIERAWWSTVRKTMAGGAGLRPEFISVSGHTSTPTVRRTHLLRTVWMETKSTAGVTGGSRQRRPCRPPSLAAGGPPVRLRQENDNVAALLFLAVSLGKSPDRHASSRDAGQSAASSPRDECRDRAGRLWRQIHWRPARKPHPPREVPRVAAG